MARVQDVGLVVGALPAGPADAITDVPGVTVGHATLRTHELNTGVTAIRPHAGNLFREPVVGAVVAGNGFAKAVGTVQVDELGAIETPILLTSTLSVWRVADALCGWMLEQPGMADVRSVNPLVGETNDGRLSDVRARAVGRPEVEAALAGARGGAVAEGAVGAGAGTVCFGWKGGIGTSSRVVELSLGPATVGVLAQTNFDGDLRMDGAPIGRLLGRGDGAQPRPDAAGSVVFVIGCDAPLDALELRRVARRCFVGLARTGSVMDHGSGDLAIAFATRRAAREGPLRPEDYDALFRATADATETAIYNSLLAAEPRSYGATRVDALPAAPVRELLREQSRMRAVRMP